jgi:hypothetical protein
MNNENTQVDALKYIAELKDNSSDNELKKYIADNPTIEIEGRSYFRKDHSPVLEPMAKKLSLNSLYGLVAYINNTTDIDRKADLMVTVASYDTVTVFGPVQGDFLQRPWYVSAENEAPSFNFGRNMEIEEFIIALQTLFVKTNDRDDLIRFVSNITAEASLKREDDGIGQQVTAKSGIRVSEMKVPNPVRLVPYRTFIEVAQPESDFLFRLQKSGDDIYCNLREADGGQWKIEAMANIREYLSENLKEGIVI